MAYIGVSVGHNSSPAVIEAADFVEIKKITAEEATSVRSVTDKPIYFHLQYSRAGQYLLPTAISFEHYTRDFIAAGKAPGVMPATSWRFTVGSSFTFLT